MGKGEMINRLLSEREKFIQWCVDYRQWMFEQYPQLLNGEALLMCTDEDLDKLSDEYDAFTLFKNMCEKQKLGDRKFCNWNAHTEEEEEIQSMADNTWDKYLIPIIDRITMKNDNGDRIFTMKSLINSINEDIELKYDSDTKTKKADNEGLCSDIKLYFDTNFITFASKDKCRCSIIKWLEEKNSLYDSSKLKDEHYKVMGKRTRGVIIVKEVETDILDDTSFFAKLK